MLRQQAVVAVCLLALAGAGLWGVWAQSRGLSAALAQYGHMRGAYDAATAAAGARWAVRRGANETTGEMRGEAARLALSSALKARQLARDLANEEDEPLRRDAIDAEEALTRAAKLLGDDHESDITDRLAPAEAHVLRALNALGGIVDATRRRVQAIEEDARRQRTRATWLGAAAGLASLLAAGVSMARLHGAVLTPMRALGAGVRRVAAGRFTQRVEPGGDDEFVELAEEFNRMAGELDGLHRDMESRIRQAGRDLAQAERRASVGFLAAGVAHEINNPLAIMSGHAELGLKKLAADTPAADDLEETRAALEVIRDEAFRCKAITDKLLSLARPGGEAKSRLALRTVAQDVVALVAGLPRHRGRQVTIRADAEGWVIASEPEMKQVLLNLVVNALEATEPGAGRVEIGITSSDKETILAVRDNGRGIAAADLPRVFEPFYSRRHDGVGLGLAIVQAIVHDHGGSVAATSEGPGQGAVFTVTLPMG